MAVEKKKEAAPETKRPEIVNSVETLRRHRGFFLLIHKNR